MAEKMTNSIEMEVKFSKKNQESLQNFVAQFSLKSKRVRLSKSVIDHVNSLSDFDTTFSPDFYKR